MFGAMKSNTQKERQDRLDSQGGLVRIADAPKLSPRDAAYVRKMGTYIDSAEVEGKDDGLLSQADALRLRESGVLVLKEEVGGSLKKRALKLPARRAVKGPQGKFVIDKSSRHQKIIGDFGESLVRSWLSRSGFEVWVVDHIGIDLIAYHSATKQRLGITVKSRMRIEDQRETESVYLFREAKGDRKKLKDACNALDCEPWLAIYVECESTADLFLTSLANYDEKYRLVERQQDAWRITKKQRLEYKSDPAIKHLEFEFKTGNWWNEPTAPRN